MKIPLIPPKHIRKIDWARGSNAKIHYSVYAYITPAPEPKHSDHEKVNQKEPCKEKCTHNHDHNHTRNKKMDNLKSIINSISENSISAIMIIRNS
jgi:hypothetical protein